MFQTIFILAVAVVGLVEFVKNYLPDSVKEKKAVMSSLSGAFSVAVACGFVALNKKIGYNIEPTIPNFILYSVGAVGIVQTSYDTLFKIFKAVVEKLKNKFVGPTDVDKASDEIVETITNTVSK